MTYGNAVSMPSCRLRGMAGCLPLLGETRSGKVPVGYVRAPDGKAAGADRHCRQKHLSDAERTKAGQVFGQIGGTELFDRLVNGSADIGEKISGLMDYYLSPPPAVAAQPPTIAEMPDGFAGFDIRDFV